MRNVQKRRKDIVKLTNNTLIRGESLLNCTYFVHVLYLINNIYKKYSNTACKNVCNNNCKKNPGKKKI